MPEQEQQAVAAVQRWLAEIPGWSPGTDFVAQPYRDGFLVAPSPMSTGAPLFAVRDGRVGLAPSSQRPTLEEVWEMLGGPPTPD